MCFFAKNKKSKGCLMTVDRYILKAFSGCSQVGVNQMLSLEYFCCPWSCHIVFLRDEKRKQLYTSFWVSKLSRLLFWILPTSFSASHFKVCLVRSGFSVFCLFVCCIFTCKEFDNRSVREHLAFNLPSSLIILISKLISSV